MSKKIIFTAIIAIGILQTTFAYPIEPVTLRELIQNSESIIWAYVDDIIVDTASSSYPQTTAKLEIKEELQGRMGKKIIHVSFHADMICPAPARYKKGELVLAFLYRSKDEGKWYTQSLSYGTKYLDEDGYKVYRDRILEMQDIKEIKDEKLRSQKTLDWLLCCMDHPVTEREGTRDLSPYGAFLGCFDKENPNYNANYSLTQIQKSQLKTMLLDEPELTFSQLGIFDLAYQEGDQELLNLLIQKIKTTEDSNFYNKKSYLTRIVKITQRQDLKTIFTKIDLIKYSDDGREGKQNKLLEEFIRLLN